MGVGDGVSISGGGVVGISNSAVAIGGLVEIVSDVEVPQAARIVKHNSAPTIRRLIYLGEYIIYKIDLNQVDW
jgi:hypothetical protein